MKRHQLSKVHKGRNREGSDSDGGTRTPEEQRVICREKTCKSYGTEYSRQDNYLRHARAKHSDLDSE